MAISSILQGKRPPRPAYPCVTGGVWKSIQQCWASEPHSRPKASEVLQILLDSSVPHSLRHLFIRRLYVLKFSNPPAWKRLINPTLPRRERVDLIKSIFSDRDESEAFEHLSGNDAQAFVDMITEASIHDFHD